MALGLGIRHRQPEDLLGAHHRELGLGHVYRERDGGRPDAEDPRLAADMVRALDEAQRTGPVKWCWLELADKRGVEVFLRFAARKAEWLTEHPARHRAAPRPQAKFQAAGRGTRGVIHSEMGAKYDLGRVVYLAVLTILRARWTRRWPASGRIK